jgi:hypothetical protein
MNEQIRQLALQCGAWYQVYNNKQFMLDGTFDVEKFAELIVRECLGCSNNLANHYIDNHSEKEQTLLLASIADYSNEIKKHFGVEE